MLLQLGATLKTKGVISESKYCPTCVNNKVDWMQPAYNIIKQNDES
jgi:hypothetical protein